MGPSELSRTVAPGRDAPAGSRLVRLTGGVTGNARLTAVTGLVLLVLFAVEGVTLLSLGSLMPVHVFVGMALIPPALLKTASTGYRFVRYYAASPAYRRAGPPPPLLRLLGPLVVASTVAVLATGVALVVAGPQAPGILIGLHKLSFVGWFAVMTVHVLGRTLRALRLAAADWERPRLGGRGLRLTLLVGTVAGGAVLGTLALGWAAGWFDRVFF